MKKRLITIFQYVVFLGFGLFLVWWTARNITDDDWRDIRNSLKNARYWLIFPIIFLLFLSHWFRALRWQILIGSLGYSTRRMNTFFAVMIGYLANLAVPRLGEVLKCTLVARYEKVPADKLVGTMIAERAVDVICLILVFVLTIALQTDIIGNYVREVFYRRFPSGGSSEIAWETLAVLGVSLLVVIGGVWFLFRRFSHLLFISKIKKILKGVWAGLMSVRTLRKRRLFLFYSVAIWGLYYVSTYIGFYALQETSIYGYKEALSALSFGSVGMIITQGGIGGYALMIQKTMELYGLKASIGLAFGWVMWLAQTSVIILFGLLSFLLMPSINKTKPA